MTSRLATPQDKTSVAILMVQAMDDLAKKFVKSDNLTDAIPAFEHFFVQKNNQYGYENTIVGEDETGIVGSITAYDGAKLDELRQPVLDYLKTHYNFNTAIENETQAGEFYLDTVSVFPHKQGLGIGAKLIQAMIQHAKKLGHERVGLLVDKTNPKAKSLYLRLGFEVVDEKSLLGGAYEHLVFEIKA